MQTHLARSAEAILRADVGELENAVRILSEVRDSGNCVWLVGNGGSAATAEHFANDLTKMAGCRAIAINSLLPSVLAYGNDNGWDRMYADLLGSLKKEGDALVAISCSGDSINVIRCTELFHHNRLIILTGNNYESLLASVQADAKVFVNEREITSQEDVHMAICHAMAGALRC